MTNSDKLDTVQRVLAQYKEGKLDAEKALAAIDQVMNPKVVTRRDVERFRSELYRRP